MDLKYPLTINSTGSLVYSSNPNQDHTIHLLDTFAGERVLSPSFGIPADLWFSRELPELTTEQIRLAIATFIDPLARVTATGFTDTKLSLEITLPGNNTIVNGTILV